MLKAIDKKGNTVISYKDYISKKKDYFCPECKKRVIFVDAELKIKHFRHQTQSDCEFEPETAKHIEMKNFILKRLNLKENNLEVPLGFAKPDVYIPKQKIAVEVQNSLITRKKFLERTQKYSGNNIYVLWIFHIDLVSERPSALLKKAHELYFGRVYCYEKGCIVPIHFNSIGRYIEPNDFSNHSGYFKWYKQLKEIKKGKPISNFSLLKIENTWKENDFLIARFYDKKFWGKRQ